MSRFFSSLLLALFAVGAPQLEAQTVIKVRDNGPSANRVDLVVLGDGYTAAELPKYTTDVDRFVLEVLAQEPFSEYKTYFNVHRIDVVSPESGADHPENTPPHF